MAATVTIEKAYFETLLRRAEFHISDEDLTTPLDLPTVTIPKYDHDSLLRMAQEYSSLKDALYRGGIVPETLEVLIRGDGLQDNLTDNLGNIHLDGNGGVSLLRHQHASSKSAALSTGYLNDVPGSNRPAKAHLGSWFGKERSIAGAGGRQHSFSHDDLSFPSDVDKDDRLSTQPAVERHQIARSEQRTIIVKNLSDRASHKDIVDIIRGGALLDVYLRTNDKSASVSFVEGSAAQAFMNHVKRNDIYIHGKRAEFVWNDRQFILPGHVAGKIHSGASRNLIIRGCHSTITAERIREDLDHIYNLVVIEIRLERGDAIISLNSVHNSLFARTCMMSRGAYKGCRIEWLPDPCAQPLPKPQFTPKKENLTPPVKKPGTMVNRFQMLNIDGTEDGSDEENTGDELASFTSMRPRVNWATSTIAT